MVDGHGCWLNIVAHTLSRQVEAGAEEDPSGLEETVKEVWNNYDFIYLRNLSSIKNEIKRLAVH